MQIYYALVFLQFCFVVAAGETVTCWNCVSITALEDDPQCGEEFKLYEKEKYNTSCDGTCMLIVSEGHLYLHWTKMYNRTCAERRACDPDYVFTGSSQVKVKVHCCDGNFCNVANFPGLAFTTLVFWLTLIELFMWH